MRYIYMLTQNDIPFYIGKTKRPKIRQSEHRRKYTGCLLEIIDIVPVEEWKFWERHYISLYRSWGFILKNIKLYSGNGSDIRSTETRIKISKANKGKPSSMLGKKHSTETKIKQSLAKIGISKSKMHAENIRKCRIGKKHSDEAKKKMSIKKIGALNPNYKNKVLK